MSNKIKNKQLEIISDFDINNKRLINVTAPIEVYDGANKEYVDYVSLNAALGTGLYSGGDVVIVDNTHFSVSSGVGFFVDNITKNIIKVSWNSFPNIEIAAFGATDITMSIGVALNQVNEPYIFQQISKFTSSQRHEIIVLGEIFIHPVTRNLFRQIFTPIYSKDLPSIVDMHSAQSPISLTGNNVTPNGSNLYLNVSSGNFIGYSINSINNRQIPNESSVNGIEHIYFFNAFYYNDGTKSEWKYGGDPYTYDNIDSSHWSDGINYTNGEIILRSSTPSKYNLRILCRCALTGTTHFLVYPSQSKEYQNIYDAESVLNSLGVNIPNELSSFVSPLAYIIIRGNATDLSDPTQCKIIPIESISASVGSVASSASDVFYNSTGAIDLSNVSTVQDALTTINNKIENLNFVLTNLNMSAISGVSIHLATAVPMLYNPKTIVMVDVNGISVKLGDGIKTYDCFFSNDGGLTAKTLDTIQQNDYLYWNEDTATYPLESDDKISFIYMYF